jgi:peptidyl-prolyl cis-trans isomerase D
VAKANSDDTGLGRAGRGTWTTSVAAPWSSPSRTPCSRCSRARSARSIETDFGYHIIQLVDVRGGEKQPFEHGALARSRTRCAESLAQRKPSPKRPSSSATWSTSSPTALQPVIDKLQARQAADRQRAAQSGARRRRARWHRCGCWRPSSGTTRCATSATPMRSRWRRTRWCRPVSWSISRSARSPLAEVRDQVREAVIADRAAALAREAGEKRLAGAPRRQGRRRRTAGRR